MLMGDVGGVYGILVSFVSTIMGYINFQKIDNALAERLFTKEPELKAVRQFVILEFF